MTSARFASLAACSILPVGRQATSPADVSSPSAGAFYSRLSSVCAATHFGVPITERGGDAVIPAPIQAFVNTWIGKPEPRPAVVRDYSFKAIIGEVPF